MGRADYLAEGDWNAMCSRCGGKFKASMLRKHWQGMWRCPRCWEPRQIQDFVRATPDIQTPPWVQPWPTPTYAAQICTLAGRSCTANYAVADCCIVDLIPDGVEDSISDWDADLVQGIECEDSTIFNEDYLLTEFGTDLVKEN